MSTSNPFDKLNVKREAEEEEEQEFKEVKGKEKNVPYGIEQKKKKVRPKEQEKVQEEGGEEGFEEVPSKTKKRRPENVEGEEGEESKGHKKRRGVNFNTEEQRDHRLKDKPRRGRQYDRQSGTGRGKEIAKGGAGGKGTWGDNPKNIAQHYNDDDYYFETALNPEKYKERQERRPRKEYKKDNEEKEGEKNGEEGETKEDKKEERKEKYKPRPIEIKEEDKLHRPENEMSLDDYLKSKEKPKEEEKEVERIKDGNPLKKTEKKQEEILGTSGAGKKKEKKKKEKKNQKEEINVDFEIGGGNDFRGGDRRRGRGRGGKGRGGYFHYKEEDFPEFQ